MTCTDPVTLGMPPTVTMTVDGWFWMFESLAYLFIALLPLIAIIVVVGFALSFPYELDKKDSNRK